MLDSRYDPLEVGNRIYELWEKSGFFNPDICVKKKVCARSAKPFSIVLPPPNVTGTLHMGHAAMLAIEDILVRYFRMRGRKTLWLPGTDHAAIATQEKVEKDIYKKEGLNRHQLGREKFLERVNQFALESHDTIINQVRRMGASIDWSREAYTLDDQRNFAVRTAFKKMYDDGLIYRGERIVNWDPKLQTTVSDDELEWKEETVPLYYLKYGPFTIATARPETKFGDKYVVVHPKDKRYEKFKHGEKFELEWINGPTVATLIKDSVMDMEFGTGAMTITPWHDATDFEIAERHKLEKEPIIDLRGKLLPIAGEFAGVSIREARTKIAEKLAGKGLLEKVEEKYVHRVAVSSRGGGTIEPQILAQWFIDVNKKFIIPNSKIKGIKSKSQTSLKEIMRQAVKSGQIKILPKRFEKIYFHWVDNLRDWCISRQIWFGHQIPVWYKNSETYCGINPPKGEGWTQDPDTLDTWFSSGLWTFSTLGWPKSTPDLKNFHPTSVLETGYDILFFWVARMVLMSGYLLGDVPFSTVYLHGLVRDEKGQKMSKSLGNIIDPLEMIAKYNADSTRLSLVIGAAPGNDMKLSEDKVRGYRNFTTKIWNAARFVLMQSTPEILKAKPVFSPKHKKYLAQAKKTKAKVAIEIEKFQLHSAGEGAYHYFWHVFADKVIEDLKEELRDEKNTVAKKAGAYRTLEKILEESLVMLHPFVPFVTEEIWQKLPSHKKGELLMVKKWIP
jgi:valyl-tRNA synthetase